MKSEVKITGFLDNEGKIMQMPRKEKTRYAVLEYLSEKFATDTDYTQPQVNEICNQWHTFGDYFLLRRELVDYGFLGRKRDGYLYWRISTAPLEQQE